MQGSTRRAFLARGGAVVVVAAAAGCPYESGATTPNNPDAVGEIAAVNGIEITFVDYEVRSRLAYVPRGDEVTVADRAADSETTVVEPRTPDREFLVLILEIANVSDDEKRIPTSAPDGTAFTEGRIALESAGTELEPVPTNPDSAFVVGGAYEYEGTWLDRLVLAVGAANGKLEGGDAVAGWILYAVPADLDFDDLVLVANANPIGPDRRLTWRFADS